MHSKSAARPPIISPQAQPRTSLRWPVFGDTCHPPLCDVSGVLGKAPLGSQRHQLIRRSLARVTASVGIGGEGGGGAEVMSAHFVAVGAMAAPEEHTVGVGQSVGIGGSHWALRTEAVGHRGESQAVYV